ncbi:DNA-directed RNA polymerase subunit beta' [Bacillus toyonensis]|uniref:DNA-directed RNA polymerase subunit beta' n=1 Tax=Bacillus toyonensis TaxID=155322 RepID=UPI002E1FAA83|nr:DNA-directed RNA polymerase subunit beta' [Bacillus toyonensis]MED2737582.1 DNA-directed RNA polymerase subunit beta' [Bacillus toyonensis]
MSILNKIDHIPLKIASPEKIKDEWSYGEVKKPETINYRTHKPEKGGLFCERIFGPIKDNQCSSHCGHYRKECHIGQVCPKCGVEVTSSRVRRERFGHIMLEAPVAHFWYFKGKENYIASLLDISRDHLQRVIYCDSRIVTEPGDTDLEYMQLLSESEYAKALDVYTEENGYKIGFEAGIGAKVIRELLSKIDLNVLEDQLKERLKIEKSKQNRTALEKRLRNVQAFLSSDNKPEWMVLEALPVMPPELRPMVQIDGGRFASSDLNELYRKVINRNIRLKRLKDMGAPFIVIENEMRMLQEAVDTLIANQKTRRPVTGPGGRPLKSLEDSLKGKQGRFRQNLLGKRVDYSGRSVIITGPKLRMNQCGIPRTMAIELFKPFVINQMIQQKKAINIKNAKHKIENGHPDVWPVLEKVTKNHPVLLNRAPTLHKLSIQSFEVIIVEGNAIQLHPLACSGFNADFDGDQMAVHVPISRKAQLEARILLMASKNLIHPQDGKSSKTPSQDMVLGCHYLTIEKDGEKGEGSYFTNEQEVVHAYELGWVTLHSKIILDVRDHYKLTGYKYLVTTAGKVIFNRSMPRELPFLNNSKILTPNPEGLFNSIDEAKNYISIKPNNPFDKKFLGLVSDYAFDTIGEEKTVELLDGMMDLGFKYAMRGGLTISLFDIETPKEKEELMDDAETRVAKVKELFTYGFITNEYRYKQTVSIWAKTSEKLAKIAYDNLMSDPDNNIAMMMGSGARGNNAQYRQLAANRGLMADPSGKTIEKPIKSNFTEGLTVNEYFISTHGSRKGMVDTALKTANSGYLTRRMVDVAQDVVIVDDDCKTGEYVTIEAIKPKVASLNERLYGRFLAEDIYDENGMLIASKDEMISAEKSLEIEKIRDKVRIRNVVTCASKRGLCQKCYGMDLATRKLVHIGQPVGVIAAQSIGEPGTQLTMRTFHTGGVAGEGDITQGLPRVEEIFEARKFSGPNDKKAVLTEVDGIVSIKEKGILKDVMIIPESEESEPVVYAIPFGFGLTVTEGQKVQKGTTLTTGPINPHDLLKVTDIETVRRYLIDEVQKVYKSQGVDISDKHIEVIVRQMSKRVVVRDSGDSKLNTGRLVDRNRVNRLNKKLINEEKSQIVVNEKVQGITEASLSVDSFLSASSFERTSEILSEAAIRGKKDKIRGLKESVIVGKLIPAGTGYYEYKRNREKDNKN